MKSLYLSQSATNTFRTCRERYRLKYELGWKFKSSTHGMQRGSAGHEMLQTVLRCWYANHFTRASLELAIEEVSRFVAEWLGTPAGARFRETERIDETVMAVQRYVRTLLVADFMQRGMTIAMLPNLLPRTDDAPRLLVEAPMLVTLRRPGPITPDRLHVKSLLKMDAVLLDGDQWVLHEHKFTDDDASAFDTRFEVDPQMPGYVYALREMLRINRIDGQVGRVALNVIRNKQPRFPSINKVKKGDCASPEIFAQLKALEAVNGFNEGDEEGCGLVSSAAVDTTRAIYEAALQEQDARGIPITDKQRTRAEQLPIGIDRWLCRHEYRYSEAEIDRWQSDAHADATLIRMCQSGNLAWSRNGHACFPQNAMPCDVRGMCVDQADEPADRESWERQDTSNDARLRRFIETE